MSFWCIFRHFPSIELQFDVQHYYFPCIALVTRALFNKNDLKQNGHQKIPRAYTRGSYGHRKSQQKLTLEFCGQGQISKNIQNEDDTKLTLKLWSLLKQWLLACAFRRGKYFSPRSLVDVNII